MSGKYFCLSVCMYCIIVFWQPCPQYNFETCVMRGIAEIAGCRFAFDNLASTSLPMCDHNNWQKYSNLAINLLNTEQKDIINQTGCLVPCTYREYKLVQEPVRRPSDRWIQM